MKQDKMLNPKKLFKMASDVMTLDWLIKNEVRLQSFTISLYSPSIIKQSCFRNSNLAFMKMKPGLFNVTKKSHKPIQIGFPCHYVNKNPADFQVKVEGNVQYSLTQTGQ